MFYPLVFAAAASILSVYASPTSLEKRSGAVATNVYNDLVFYFKYASSAYGTVGCTRPNGNTLVSQISGLATDTQGFIARDDTRKEIVVALRGSSSITDFITDATIALTSYSSPGASAPAGTLVHTGFQTAWNSVASSVISSIKSQLAAHPDYSIVTSGHSLGGALSSLAAASLKANFPNNAVRMYTYGQPRTGNPTYAKWINSQFGENAFRGVHTTDGVPTIIPTYYGYQHHGVEYWDVIDPSNALTTRKCSASGEDLTCSASIISSGINAAHLTYYNVLASTTFCI
ncbi:alpha/beta-hydrolase [Crepidotus variabilis]|uniref:Alpha/beta-hydrolase n=1 Tax=Crepidotus variabilis TaxID=179855 RepID=A0A9P6JRM5_9AGAR|nr:alpha/beta-hydrolase [Crepidotus variabilis]